MIETMKWLNTILDGIKKVNQQFHVGPDRFVACDGFLSVFWLIYCYNKYGQEGTFLSRHYGLFRFSSVLVCAHWYFKGPEEAEMSRRKRVFLSILIVTIDPSTDTEKYIADDEAVWSNIKLLTNSPLEGKWSRLREANGLSLESLHKNEEGEVFLFLRSGNFSF